MDRSNRAALGRFLHRLLLRSSLSPEEQAVILDLRSHAIEAPAHRDIVSPGEKVDHACLVVDGLVGRFDQMKNGSRQITAIHIPGDLCDLHSVVAPVAGWGLDALATSTILHIPHGELRAAAVAYPAIAMAFWRDTTADASILAKWVGNIGRKDAMARLAHLLCELGMRMEQAELGTRTEYTVPITQTQLGDVLGLTSVHVNRTMQALRRDGIVRTRNKTIHIDDWPRLLSLAEFDPRFLLVAPMDQQEAA